jgi:hypothetical protein
VRVKPPHVPLFLPLERLISSRGFFVPFLSEGHVRLPEQAELKNQIELFGRYNALIEANLMVAC